MLRHAIFHAMPLWLGALCRRIIIFAILCYAMPMLPLMLAAASDICFRAMLLRHALFFAARATLMLPRHNTSQHIALLPCCFQIFRFHAVTPPRALLRAPPCHAIAAIATATPLFLIFAITHDDVRRRRR